MSDVFVFILCWFYVSQSFEVMESPEMLIKSFQALQEERVHTYKSFEEYVHWFHDTVEVTNLLILPQEVYEVLW